MSIQCEKVEILLYPRYNLGMTYPQQYPYLVVEHTRFITEK